MLEEDEPLLRQKAKECKSAEEKIRYYALHAISKGDSITDTADRFLVERQTVHDWINRWKDEKDLSNKSKPGKPPSLTPKDDEEIKRLINENNPDKYGINASFWNTKGLQEYFEKKGKTVSREVLRQHLQNTGARYIKATFVYNEGDIEKKREYAKYLLNLLENEFKHDDALLFTDEASVCTVPHKGYGWTFEQRLVIGTDQSNRKRANAFGAVDPINGEVIQMVSAEAKAPAMILFLQKLCKRFPKGKIYLCLDNGKVHHAKIVKKWLDKHKRVVPIFQPTYSPDVNLQEQFWHHEREALLNNRQFDTVNQAITAMNRFVKRLTSADIRSVCNFIPIEMYLS